ncbi:MAG: hypothetical protein R8J84_01710 [Mariprofundales bacterium]
MKWLKLTLIGFLALATLLLAVSWWQKDRVAEQLLTQLLPQLKYSELSIDSTQGQLRLRGVAWQQPGLALHGGDLTVKVDRAALIQQRLTIEHVLLRNGQIIVSPEMLDTASPTDTMTLPHQVTLRSTSLTLHAPWANEMAPLILNVDAYQQPKGWSLQATLPLGGGQMRVAAIISSMDRYSAAHNAENISTKDSSETAIEGSIRMEGIALPQLLRQLALTSPVPLSNGSVTATLDWTLPLAQPAAARVQGLVHLANVELLDPLQHRKQSFPEIDAKVDWNGATEQLTLSQLQLNQPHLRWNQPLLLAGKISVRKKEPSTAITEHNRGLALRWKVDALQVNDGKITLALITPVGRMQLPLRIASASVREIRSDRWWPTESHVAASAAGGTIKLDWQKKKLQLDIHCLRFRDLEPLALSVIGHRTPLGTMNASLQGTVKKTLDLHGDFTFHHLAISPRIPVIGVHSSVPYALGLRALTDDAATTRFPLAIGGSWQQPVLNPSAAITLAKQHPFRGGLDGDIRWQAVDFLSGKDQLTPTGYKQLAQLRDMLAYTAVTSLELRGCVDPVVTRSTALRQRLAAARTQRLRSLLKQGQTVGLTVRTVYPKLTDPSPDIDGNRDRVEVAIYPSKMK